MDFGRFMTGFLVLTGIGELSVLLPLGLATAYLQQSLPGQPCHYMELISHDCGDSVAATVLAVSHYPDLIC
jgi:hypothetical protein